MEVKQTVWTCDSCGKQAKSQTSPAIFGPSPFKGWISVISETNLKFCSKTCLVDFFQEIILEKEEKDNG